MAEDIKVRRVKNENAIFHVPVESDTVLDQGDLIKISSNYGVLMTSSADVCFGVVTNGSYEGDSSPVTVAKEAVIEAKTTTAFDIGDEGVYTGGSATADWTVGSASTSTYVEAVEEISSGSKGKFYFKI